MTIDVKASAALKIYKDTLYAAYRTGDSNHLNNVGGVEDKLLFKTGGSLDLMLCSALSASKLSGRSSTMRTFAASGVRMILIKLNK